MNPILGLAFGLLLIKVLLPVETARASEDLTDDERAARIARRKARRERAKRESAKESKPPKSDSKSSDEPAT